MFHVKHVEAIEDAPVSAPFSYESVRIEGRNLLAIMPLGMLVESVRAVVHFPFAIKTYKRMTQGSKWAPENRRYLEWCKSVREWYLRSTPAETDAVRSQPCVVGLLISGGLRSISDAANGYKAVEDALRGAAYPDDNIKHVVGQTVRYVSPPPGVASFSVVIGR